LFLQLQVGAFIESDVKLKVNIDIFWFTSRGLYIYVVFVDFKYCAQN